MTVRVGRTVANLERGNGYTDDEVTQALRAVVAEKGGDYVTPNACRYRNPDLDGDDPNCPDCIIGHLLRRLGDRGWDNALVSVTGDFGGISTLNESRIGSSHWDGYTDLTERQRYWLESAQCVQDTGGTWGSALAAYERRHRQTLGLSEDEDE